MVYLRKDLDISKAVAQTEDFLPKEDFVEASKAKLLAAMKTKVQLAGRVVKREVLRITVEEISLTCSWRVMRGRKKKYKIVLTNTPNTY